MNIRAINLNLFTALDALLEERSVTRAARRAGLSQPAMSHNLAQLRGMLSDPLLVRGGLLTPLAEALRPRLRMGLTELQHVLEARQDFDPAISERTFRIAVSDAFQITSLHRLIAHTAAKAPHVNFVFKPPRASGLEALATGALDLVVGSSEQKPAERARSQVLFQEHFVCLVRADHPGVGTRLSMPQFCRLAHAMVADDEAPSQVDRILARQGERRRIALRVPDYAGLGHAIACSDLVATVPSRLAHALAHHLPLRSLATPVRLPRFPILLYWHERFDADPGHSWLRERLREIALATDDRAPSEARADSGPRDRIGLRGRSRPQRRS